MSEWTSSKADNLYADNEHSINEGITVQVSARKYLRGDVLGQVTMSVPTTGTAGSNTGDGSMTAVGGRQQTMVGTYIFTCVEKITNGGRFAVTDPSGDSLADAMVGTAYKTRYIDALINHGTVTFEVDDSFTVDVAVGSKEYKLCDSSASDGSQVAKRVLQDDNVDATTEAQRVIADMKGCYNEQYLQFGGSDTIETHREDMHKRGLYTKEVVK